MEKFPGREFCEFYVTFVLEIIFMFVVVEKALPLNHLDGTEVDSWFHPV